MMKHTGKKKGFTIAEMLVSLIIVAVSAALLAPKVLNTQGETAKQAVTLKVDAQKYQMGTNIKMFENKYNLSDSDLTTEMQNPTSTVTFNTMFMMFGNYYAYKNSSAGDSYYFLMDRSKISFNRNFFLTGVYATTPAAKRLPNFETANGNHCKISLGSSAYEYPCFYIDVNGPGQPNAFGKTGDIIPMYIDPDNYEVTTLYEAKGICAAYSQYDALVHPVSITGAASCP